MVQLKDLRLGSLAAESDQDLFNYFLLTPVGEAIVRQPIGIVAGRKGSGKTALFVQMEELLQSYDHGHVKVLRLNMDDHAWGAFADFRLLGLSTEHAATVSWQLALLLQLTFAVVAEPPTTWRGEAARDVNVLRRFVEDNFGEMSPQLAKSSRLIGQLGGLTVSAFGASLEAKFADSNNTPRELVPGLTDAISQHLVHPLVEGAWMIGLDQLDESWDGTQEKKDLLVGLLKGVQRINNDFGWRVGDSQGVRAVAFLRTDILESLDFDDKDKLRDAIAEISWTHDQLRLMLQQRVDSTDIDDLFESRTNQRKGRIPKGSFNYLASRTFMRPRDLLQFLQQLRLEAPEAYKVSRALVNTVEPRYSRDKVDDLRQEYRRGAPWVTTALDSLKQGPNKFESRTELEARLSERVDLPELRASGISSVSDLVDWMTEASILGAATRRVATETIRFRCEGAPVSLEGDSTAWVHPALFIGLALTEPRASRQRDA